MLHLVVPFKLNNSTILSLAKNPNQLIINFSRVLYGNLTGESLAFSPYFDIIEVDNVNGLYIIMYYIRLKFQNK